MRLDLFLKASRLCPRRSVAQMLCDAKLVYLNDRPAKSGLELKVRDVVHLELGSRAITVEVVRVPEGAVAAQDAADLYRIIAELRRPPEVLSWSPDQE